MIKIIVYMEDGNTPSYEVKDIYKAVEHAFAIMSKGWRNQSASGKWMEYYVPTEILKVVIEVPKEQKWTPNETPEVVVDLKDGTSLAFNLFFEKSVREFAYQAVQRGFGYLSNDGTTIELRPRHQVRKIYWGIEETKKDLMMSKYEAKVQRLQEELKSGQEGISEEEYIANKMLEGYNEYLASEEAREKATGAKRLKYSLEGYILNKSEIDYEVYKRERDERNPN